MERLFNVPFITSLTRLSRAGLFGILLLGVSAPVLDAQEVSSSAKPSSSAKSRSARSDFPDYDQVIDGYEKVVSTIDGSRGLYTIWVDKKKNRMLAELPRDYASKKYFVALTISSGEPFAGLQSGDLYVYWKRFDDELALIEAQLSTRATGAKEAKQSVKRIFTDRVLVSIPIKTISPAGTPVIPMDQLLTVQAPKFFGFSLRGVSGKDLLKLREIKTAKAFPKNVELAYTVPLQGGTLKTLHYSFSEIPNNTGYKPRKADDRVGFFTTAFDDLSKYQRGQTRTRYINRWHLQKADPSLKKSPPKEPIIFYIEHTTPIRYRPWVRKGILAWNKAFEKVGLVDAIVVYQQDATTGAHMDKDPEDVRYNFVRWLNNNISTAIGPSRVHPLTGQILDADIVLTDGWIRAFERDFSNLLPKLAVQGYGPDTLAWLEQNPSWDPRILLSAPAEREHILRQRALRAATLDPNPQTKVLGDEEHDGLVGRVSQVNGMCLAADGKAMDMSFARMTLDLLAAAAADNKEDGDQDEDAPQKLDGMPEDFIGPLLADLVAHEVGHTLGLRHNFCASALYTLEEINSEAIKGKKPFAASVMDYLPVNINMKDGKIQGDYAMIGVGPYDLWAIEYGYTFAKDLKPILKKCNRPEYRYVTDQDTSGPDPLARRYDFSKKPLDFAKNQIKIATNHRQRLIDKYVQEGDSWAKLRQAYELTLSLQTRSLSMMANWLGGTFVRREHKGDADRTPIEPASVKDQREALEWVIENAFNDKAFGLTPDLLRRMKGDQLQSDERFGSGDITFPIHDRVMGIQSSVLTMVMNPTTLKQIYDNEFLLEADEDAFTLPELLDTVCKAVWTELTQPNGDADFSVRKPMISSLRRNLQRTFVERLIDLTLPGNDRTAATKPISNLALMKLRELNKKVGDTLKDQGGELDPYTRAHLEDVQTRITKALEAQYIYNAKDIAGSSGGFSFILGQPGSAAAYNRPGCVHCQRQPIAPQGWQR